MHLSPVVHGVLRLASTLLPLTATVQLRAQWDLRAVPATIQGGYTAALHLFDPEDAVVLDGIHWQWAVVGEPQGGQFFHTGG